MGTDINYNAVRNEWEKLYYNNFNLIEFEIAYLIYQRMCNIEKKEDITADIINQIYIMINNKESIFDEDIRHNLNLIDEAICNKE